MEITKKTLYIEPTASMLRIWKNHKWIAYDEFNPSGKEKAKGIFKIVNFTMPNNFVNQFILTEIEYLNWRKAKPSFRLGQ